MFTTEEKEKKIAELVSEGKFDEVAFFITNHSNNSLDLQLNIMLALREAKRKGAES